MRHGHALVKALCARCHAVGRTGRSPYAGAPPFRGTGRSYDLDGFAERLERGISAGHPDMPESVFTRADALTVQAYLRSIQPVRAV
ncbi:MAG: cytochrome c [Pseudolabrys sp.]